MMNLCHELDSVLNQDDAGAHVHGFRTRQAQESHMALRRGPEHCPVSHSTLAGLECCLHPTEQMQIVLSAARPGLQTVPSRVSSVVVSKFRQGSDNKLPQGRRSAPHSTARDTLYSISSAIAMLTEPSDLAGRTVLFTGLSYADGMSQTSPAPRFMDLSICLRRCMPRLPICRGVITRTWLRPFSLIGSAALNLPASISDCGTINTSTRN
ncbi:hypothetical protein B0T16DRAFT_110908 [Cercophora newfieldiana]|uniref:Uncharacterized protein n=1 Tax=Cercophora newfieldiana TaxID=92897 RepID=A0AA40CVH8_9PEZI|nr:hypothetical protein B0T16DRAFT_110908 [Cercophora newfieldiana]